MFLLEKNGETFKIESADLYWVLEYEIQPRTSYLMIYWLTQWKEQLF